MHNTRSLQAHPETYHTAAAGHGGNSRDAALSSEHKLTNCSYRREYELEIRFTSQTGRAKWPLQTPHITMHTICKSMSSANEPPSVPQTHIQLPNTERPVALTPCLPESLESSVSLEQTLARFVGVPAVQSGPSVQPVPSRHTLVAVITLYETAQVRHRLSTLHCGRMARCMRLMDCSARLQVSD